MSKLFLFIIASLLVSLLVLVYHFPSVMLITEHFSEDTMAGRIQVMRRACLKHRDNLKLSSTYNYTKVDRFSVGGG